MGGTADTCLSILGLYCLDSYSSGFCDEMCWSKTFYFCSVVQGNFFVFFVLNV